LDRKVAFDEQARLKNEAELLRLRFEHGLCSKADVIAWADGEIERSAHPEATVTDVALAVDASPQDVLGLLRQVPGSADAVAIRRRFCGELADRIRHDPATAAFAARVLYKMALDGEVTDTAAERQMLSFDGEFEVAPFTGHDTHEIATRLLTFLDSQRGGEQPGTSFTGVRGHR
jgi:hypothetical protein